MYRFMQVMNEQITTLKNKKNVIIKKEVKERKNEINRKATRNFLSQESMENKNWRNTVLPSIHHPRAVAVVP